MFAAPVSVNQYANRQARAPLADRQQTAGRSEPLGDVIGSVPQGYAPFSFAAPGRNVSLSVNPFIVAGGPPPLQTALPTARNIGAAPGAVGVYSGNSLDFKNLLAGSGISISSTSSNVIITATGATSAAFLQGGNAFGASAVLGTTDNNRLIVKTDGITALTLNTDQSAQFAGALSVAGTATVGSPLIIQGATSGSLSLSVPSVVTSYAVTWPAAQGSGALTNNGAGSLSWVPSSSTAGVVNPSMSAAQIQAVISNPALNSVVFSPEPTR